ncbi:hypothetical protein OHA79_05330 [Streptomyces sp. NBC_00841]|uniref:hypothetical protein n=1 Tax=Streptomyces sp. NBC_00841 TaxID=2975847 RepID=UPI002DDC740E|nr:hypothetical protein [Streptomyces sp. NBC_00841]WRZ97347.1 hypothetical protein OHA79_05330 [Streptomyces sp. NBC_00841]
MTKIGISPPSARPPPGGIKAPWPPRRLRLPGGERVALRAAGPSDRRAVGALYALCARLPVTGRAAVARLLCPRMGCALLAEAAERRPVALAGLHLDGDGAELILLIAPAWWARGLGDVLMAELLAGAQQLRVWEV